jgi:predicted pyridoxine 5'-phosphate oxidase superfamily flavin-nucleotide-binding protein
MLNIIENPHLGIIFMIPKLDETLRINGKACITNDKDLLVHMKANGKEPSIGIGVEVQECFLHCAKAFIRSGGQILRNCPRLLRYWQIIQV